MIQSQGLDIVQTYGRALLDYSQSFVARAIAAIPPGEYRFDDVLDDDGTGYGPVAIRAVVRIAGETASVDLTGCDKQVAGCVNCPASVAKAAVYYCFCCLLDAGMFPSTAGAFATSKSSPNPAPSSTPNSPPPLSRGIRKPANGLSTSFSARSPRHCPEKSPQPVAAP